MIKRSLAVRGLGWVGVFGVLAAGCSVGAGAGTQGSTSGSLAGRVHTLNQALKVTPPSGGLSAQTFSASGSSAYTYVAAVAAPKASNGDVLQATNFAFDATHAYVTYNMDGPKFEGALDVVDLTDPTNPQLVASLVFADSEYADIALRGTTAFLVGANADGGLMTVVDFADPTQPKQIGSLALGSDYGTSISLDGKTAYVSTGATAGGIATVDVSDPAGPTRTGLAPLSNALSAVTSNGATFALGGDASTVLYAVSGGVASPIATLGADPSEAPARMDVVGNRIITNAEHSGLSVLTLAGDGSASLAFHADLDGTGNGVDVAGSLAILAQGEIGTLLYDFTNPSSPALLGSFAFPDESGSSNEVRFGSSAGNDYVFLSDGLEGFRIVRIGAASDDAGAACATQWWLDAIPGDWWSVPATSDASSPGQWTPVPSETSDICLVEQFIPDAANAQCSAVQVKRAIAVGPHPNEGQVCPVTCPVGTVIANVHTRYGEASPLNAGGDYSCTNTSNPDQNEISCDVMSDFCDGQQVTCAVTYDNSFCGDPWYNCIKSGRTKWQCVPQTT